MTCSRGSRAAKNSTWLYKCMRSARLYQWTFTTLDLCD